MCCGSLGLRMPTQPSLKLTVQLRNLLTATGRRLQLQRRRTRWQPLKLLPGNGPKIWPVISCLACSRRRGGWRFRCGGRVQQGIHRSALCQRAELTPAELRSTMMRMGHRLGRFQRERGITLTRPVAANSPLQSYFVDPDFAAVANFGMFSDGTRVRPVDGVGRP